MCLTVDALTTDSVLNSFGNKTQKNNIAQVVKKLCFLIARMEKKIEVRFFQKQILFISDPQEQNK